MIVVLSILLFACVLAIYAYMVVFERHQCELPDLEDEPIEYERPNVFYSKDIQIVSEPEYLKPPYKVADMYFIQLEKLENHIAIHCFIEGNSISIQIKDSTLFAQIDRIQAHEYTKAMDIATDYLKSKKILE